MLPFPFVESMMMFFIYSFIGWVVEVCYYGVTEERFINRGFLAGPMCPIYGLGFYGVIWFVVPYASPEHFPIIFFGSAVVCTIVELLVGVFLYKVFHLTWWDYSDYRLNFKGYICLRFTIYWGIACSLGIYLLHPLVIKLIYWTPEPVRIVFVVFFSIILVIDLVMTVISIIGFKKKIKGITAITTGIRTTSDSIGTGIYGVVKTTSEVTSSLAENTTQGYWEFTDAYQRHRKEERELASAHRKEEREILAKSFTASKEDIQESFSSAAQNVKSFASRFKQDELRILSVLRPSTKSEESFSVRILKKYYDIKDRNLEEK